MNANTEFAEKMISVLPEAAVIAAKEGVICHNDVAFQLLGEFMELPEEVLEAIEEGTQDLRLFSGCSSRRMPLDVYMSPLDENGAYLILLRRSAPQRDLPSLTHIAGTLRAPLTSLVAAFELLERRLNEQQDPQISNWLAIINRSYFRLLRISANLSNFSSFEDGTVRLNAHAANLGEFCAGLCRNAEDLALGQGIQLTCVTDGRETVLPFDRNKMERLVMNLIANAMAHTPRGGAISLSVRRTDTDAVLTVQDTGSGIDQNALNAAFRMFGAEELSFPANPESGLGLGLGLCKKIAELHGGRIMISSRAGAGTCVTVSLPLKTPDGIRLYSPLLDYDYSGGFDHTLFELCDVVPYNNFGKQHNDKKE